MFQGTYLYSFIKIGSVTAEILMALSFCSGVGWVVCKVIFVANPTKAVLGSGFDNSLKY